MVSITKEFFKNALELGHISKGQYDMIMLYIADPQESMKVFMKEHPEFIENSLKADNRTRERAQLCIDKGIYA